MAASASDWSCRVENLLQPIRNTIQILVVNDIRMEFLRSFLRLHFAVKPEVASQILVVFSGLVPWCTFHARFPVSMKSLLEASAERPKTRRSAADPETSPPHSIKTFATQSKGLTIENPVNFVFGTV